MVELTLTDVTKRYDDTQGTEVAVDDLSLTVEDELVVLLGPSGCGKTTTLRMIAGLETVTDGRISIDGRDVTDLHPSDRSIAMVFQDYGLYTTMSVRENMAYGLKHSTSLSASERRDRVEEMATMFGIEDLLARDVSDLSGGQKQRVALGRAMVREPDVFLLDEPLASLDAKLRSEMRTELQQLQSRLDITTVYVTHDQKEAMTMADRVVVLDGGRLQQVGPPEEVYASPTNRFVADFLGNPPMNQLPAVVVDGGPSAQGLRYAGDAAVSLGTVPASTRGVTPGDEVIAGMRPESLSLTASGPETAGAAETETTGFPGTVTVTEYQGNDNFVHFAVGDEALTAVVGPDVEFSPGERVSVHVAPEDLYLFDPATGDALSTGADARERRPGASR
ncbi:ABC transporter ATP-binding protein [Salinirubrum litoreum]|uniref:ABC-type D-xylose/L-arabinose transporter n=1 Tax=Salinirubrum litoreum TaxID=1126234 RepID=A0ABD5RGK9_9EURY|nr:ABC transporter ATP-binding protein [Salinirubrum litoreum]